MIPLLKKELSSLFKSPIAYIFIFSFFAFNHWYFCKNLFLLQQATMDPFFFFTPYLFLFLIPAITMRTWAEEKKAGTLDFLFTFPITESQLVWAKYIATLLFLFLILLSTLPLVFLAVYFGNPDGGAILGGYVALFLLGSALISIGFVASSLSSNQVIAFIISTLLSFFFFSLSTPAILYSLPEWLGSILQSLSLEQRYSELAKGLFTLTDSFFFLVFSFFFLVINISIFEMRRIEK